MPGIVGSITRPIVGRRIRSSGGGGGGGPNNLSLVHHWAMDEGATATRLDGQGSIHLASNGSMTQETGLLNNAAGVHGAEYLSGTTVADMVPSGPLSIAGWYQHQTGGSSFGRLAGIDNAVANQQCWEMLRANGYFMCYVWDTTGTRYSPYYVTATTAGNWYFVVLALDPGNQIRVSVNASVPSGVSVTDISAVTLETSTVAPIQMGGSSAITTRWVIGNLDEWGIYNKALTDADITWLYNSGTPRSKAEILAH